MITIQKAVLLMTVTVGMMACKKEFTNPNNALVTEALSSPGGIANIAIGLQRSYGTTRVGSIYNLVTANGFSTFELSNRNSGNVDETALSIGGTTLDGSNNVLGNLWATNLKIIFDANRVIAAADGLSDKNYASGIIAYATIYKALAQGSLAMYWERVPDTAGTGLTVNFINRTELYQKAISSIDKALAAVAANPPSTQILNLLTPGLDFVNSLNAIKARYQLFSNEYSAALATANLVNLSSKSEIRYDAANPNPIFQISTSTNNVFQVIDSSFGLPLALQPDYPADRRISFYMSISPSTAPRWRISGFGAAITTPWPIYLPGEIILIKAECYARLSTPDLANATTQLNIVRTKTPASDLFGVGAQLGNYSGPNTAADILTEIYRQRCIELYMQGFKMEDMRRFGRPNTPNVEKKRNFFPYPFRERDNNPNTPADPAF